MIVLSTMVNGIAYSSVVQLHQIRVVRINQDIVP